MGTRVLARVPSTNHISNLRFYSLTNEKIDQLPPSQARVVICGGGVQGAALAYYLAQNGWAKDTIVLDQGKIGRAYPWHMSGLIGIFKPTLTETRITEESVQLYDQLARLGQPTGFKQCGSLLLARTRVNHLLKFLSI